MSNYRDFGGEKYPIRCSKIALVVRCPVKVVLEMDGDSDLGGAAAQIGNVVHKAIEAYHTEPEEQKRTQAGLDQLQSCLPMFPAVQESAENQSEALRHFTLYAADPRNIKATVIANERSMRMKLKPHTLDPTGRDIVVTGTLDQIRKVNTLDHVYEPSLDVKPWLAIYDVKTGKPSGFEMTHEYAVQQAAYTLLALTNGYDISAPAQLIRTQGYRVRGAELPSPAGVFWWTGITIEKAYLLIDHFRLSVAMIRSGEINWGPSPFCTYCQWNPLSNCTDIAKEKLNLHSDTTYALPMISPLTPRQPTLQ